MISSKSLEAAEAWKVFIDKINSPTVILLATGFKHLRPFLLIFRACSDKVNRFVHKISESLIRKMRIGIELEELE